MTDTDRPIHVAEIFRNYSQRDESIERVSGKGGLQSALTRQEKLLAEVGMAITDFNAAASHFLIPVSDEPGKVTEGSDVTPPASAVLTLIVATNHRLDEFLRQLGEMRGRIE